MGSVESLPPEALRFWAEREDARGLVQVDPDGRISFWNAGAARIAGYTAVEALGRKWTDLAPLPEVGVERPQSLVRKDGTSVVARVVMSANRRDGELLGFSLILRDLPELAPAASSEIEERYRACVDHAADALFLLRDGVVVDVNRAACESLGYTREEMLGNVPSKFDPDVTPAKLEDITRRLSAGETVAFDSRHRRKDGTLFPVEVRIRVFVSGGVPFGLSLVRDISERKRNECALQKSEEMLRRAQAIAHVASWSYDIKTDRFDISEEGWRMMGGRTSDPPSAKDLMKVVHPDDREQVEIAWSAACEGTPYQIEHRLLLADDEAWVFSLATADVDEEGRPAKLVGVTQDVTERRKLAEKLRQAQKLDAIGQLAGGVAHDFNNLLTVINSSAEFLFEEITEAPLRDILGEIQIAGTRAADLTRQLLAFSRQQVMRTQVVDFNSVVNQSKNMVRSLIGEEEITLITALEPDLPKIDADPGQLVQVLLNLVANARDAMPVGGTLTIETKNRVVTADNAEHGDSLPNGLYVELQIKDTGIGVPEKLREKIFEPFFSTKGVGKGTGLGLATVYGIVKQSGGHIRVTSRVGAGTTMTLLFRATASRPTASAPDAPTGSDHASAPTFRGDETILLVEDEDAVRRVVRIALERNGYRVLEANSGPVALELAASHAGLIHLLLTDVVMPSMSGRQVADRIREREPTLKVLFMSGYTDDAIVRDGMLAANEYFLAKPFAPLALVRTVREALGAPESVPRT